MKLLALSIAILRLSMVLICLQGHHEAINDARRLIKHHPEVLRNSLHEFIRAAVPAVEQLRSATVKNALLMFQELFQSLGKAADKELDDIVPILLKKAGELSNAGVLKLFRVPAAGVLSMLLHDQCCCI